MRLGCSYPLYKSLLVPEGPLDPADAIVVLGAFPVDDQGNPSPEIIRRVEHGVKLYQKGLTPCIIVCGGNTYKHFFESAIMAELAEKLGVPRGKIIEERESLTTVGNARRATAIMRERGLASCILVSSRFHLKRAKRLFEAGGVDVQASGAELPEDALYGPRAALHEWLANLYFLFYDSEKLVMCDAADKHVKKVSRE